VIGFAAPSLASSHAIATALDMRNSLLIMISSSSFLALEIIIKGESQWKRNKSKVSSGIEKRSFSRFFILRFQYRLGMCLGISERTSGRNWLWCLGIWGSDQIRMRYGMISSRVLIGFEVDKDLGTRAEIHAMKAEWIGERRSQGERSITFFLHLFLKGKKRRRKKDEEEVF